MAKLHIPPSYALHFNIFFFLNIIIVGQIGKIGSHGIVITTVMMLYLLIITNGTHTITRRRRLVLMLSQTIHQISKVVGEYKDDKDE
jgi:hypothetical protein